MAEYVNFNKPYPNGWANNAAGETPITAEILNNNYDAFFTSLNNWAAEIKPVSANATGVLVVENLTLLRVDGTNYKVSEVHANPTIPGGTTPPDLSYIAIDGTNYTIPSGGSGATTLDGLTDVTISSPSNGQVLTYNSTSSKWENSNASGGGDTVSWTQVQATGTKIAEIEINGTATNVYAPTSGGASYTDLTANISSGATTVTINDASITTSSAFFPFSDPFGLVITNMVATTGSITITFLPAATNYTLKVRVW